MVGTSLDWLSTVGSIREDWQDSDEQIIGDADALSNFELNLGQYKSKQVILRVGQRSSIPAHFGSC